MERVEQVESDLNIAWLYPDLSLSADKYYRNLGKSRTRVTLLMDVSAGKEHSLTNDESKRQMPPECDSVGLVSNFLPQLL